jgi:hypothetical protein
VFSLDSKSLLSQACSIIFILSVFILANICYFKN